MQFLKLSITYEKQQKEINLFNKTLIYSDDNSVGKSTLLRLLLYGLGYPIPGTYGLNFKKVNTRILFERDKKIYLVKRLDDYIELYKGDEFIAARKLTGDDYSWLSYVWGIDSIRVLKNILGAIYMDQDKGWTLLNRGKVIGNVRFNIRDLLIGLSKNGQNLDGDLVRLEQQKKVLTRTRQLRDLSKSAEDYKESSLGSIRNPDDRELNDRYQNLKLKKRVIKQNIKNIKRNIDNEQGLLDYLISLNIMVKVKGKITVVNKDNLLNFNDNLEFLKQRSAILQEDLEKIQIEITEVKNKLEDNVSSLFSGIDVIDKTLNDISKININDSVLEARENELKNSISDLNLDIESRFTDSNELIDDTRKWINLFADKLGISDVVKDKKYIFTRDLKSISGTIYYKVVFSFKMAYIKIIEEHTGLTLPIILDSPSGREVTDRNISDVISILNEYFNDNQIIIASINKYDLKDVKEIELRKRIFENEFELKNTNINSRTE
ncbi:hypothetical protein [Lactiplantibacillus plantarum]|uniref:hypothetical protein n=1 Tax=Lactiplantibacillus plantarum TaxID=1590 RepID=UPI0028691446|nr:hypothetical protein [Lactiplantibacillus plantarum]WMX73199.1 hypothetical protein RF670_14325 [Lactiplantibacillus plantarum]